MMKRTGFHNDHPQDWGHGLGFIIKSTTAMSVVALAVVGSLAPEIVKTGLSWEQGLVALAGGILGAFLALKH